MFYLNPYLLCAVQKKGKQEHSTAKLHHFGLLRDVSQIMQHVINMMFTAVKVNVFLLIITYVLVNAYSPHVIWMHKNTYKTSRYLARGYHCI